MAKNKKPAIHEYPKVIETFRKIGQFETRNWIDDEPSAFNGAVRVEKYRITIEKIEEPIEVIQERLETLWANCDNHHHLGPLQSMAKQFNYEFKVPFGSLKKQSKL